MGGAARVRPAPPVLPDDVVVNCTPDDDAPPQGHRTHAEQRLARQKESEADARRLLLRRGFARRPRVGIHEAIQRGQVAVVRDVCAKYGGKDDPWSVGWTETPLMVACQAYHLPERVQYEIIEHLLAAGHNIAAVDAKGRSAVALAIHAAPRDASTLPPLPRFPLPPLWCVKGERVLVRLADRPHLWAPGCVVSRSQWDLRHAGGEVLYTVKLAVDGTCKLVMRVDPSDCVKDEPPPAKCIELGVTVLVRTGGGEWRAGVVVATAPRGGHEVEVLPARGPASASATPLERLTELGLEDLRLPPMPQPVADLVPATEGLLYPGRRVFFLPLGARRHRSGLIQSRNLIDGGYDIIECDDSAYRPAPAVATRLARDLAQQRDATATGCKVLRLNSLDLLRASAAPGRKSTSGNPYPWVDRLANLKRHGAEEVVRDGVVRSVEIHRIRVPQGTGESLCKRVVRRLVMKLLGLAEAEVKQKPEGRRWTYRTSRADASAAAVPRLSLPRSPAGVRQRLSVAAAARPAATPRPGDRRPFTHTPAGAHSVALAARAGHLEVLEVLSSLGLLDSVEALEDWVEGDKAVDVASDPDVVLFFLARGAAYSLAKAAALSKTGKARQWVQVLQELLLHARSAAEQRLLFEQRYPTPHGLNAVAWACKLGNTEALELMFELSAPEAWQVPMSTDWHRPLALLVKSPMTERKQDEAIRWLVDTYPHVFDAGHLLYAAGHLLKEGCGTILGYLLDRGVDVHYAVDGVLPCELLRDYATYGVLDRELRRRGAPPVVFSPVELVERILESRSGSIEGGAVLPDAAATDAARTGGSATPSSSSSAALSPGFRSVVLAMSSARLLQHLARGRDVAEMTRLSHQHLGWWRLLEKASPSTWERYNRDGDTALTLAIRSGDAALVAAVLHPGRADINTPTAHGRHPLAVAVACAGTAAGAAMVCTLLEHRVPRVGVLGTGALPLACALPTSELLVALLRHAGEHFADDYYVPKMTPDACPLLPPPPGDAPASDVLLPPAADRLLHAHPLLETDETTGATVIATAVAKGWGRAVLAAVPALPRFPEAVVRAMFTSRDYALMATVLQRSPALLQVGGDSLLHVVLEGAAPRPPSPGPRHAALCAVVRMLIDRMDATSLQGTGVLFLAALRNNREAVAALTAKLAAAGRRWTPDEEAGAGDAHVIDDSNGSRVSPVAAAADAVVQRLLMDAGFMPNISDLARDGRYELLEKAVASLRDGGHGRVAQYAKQTSTASLCSDPEALCNRKTALGWLVAREYRSLDDVAPQMAAGGKGVPAFARVPPALRLDARRNDYVLGRARFCDGEGPEGTEGAPSYSGLVRWSCKVADGEEYSDILPLHDVVFPRAQPASASGTPRPVPPEGCRVLVPAAAGEGVLARVHADGVVLDVRRHDPMRVEYLVAQGPPADGGAPPDARWWPEGQCYLYARYAGKDTGAVLEAFAEVLCAADAPLLPKEHDAEGGTLLDIACTHAGLARVLWVCQHETWLTQGGWGAEDRGAAVCRAAAAGKHAVVEYALGNWKGASRAVWKGRGLGYYACTEPMFACLVKRWQGEGGLPAEGVHSLPWCAAKGWVDTLRTLLADPHECDVNASDERGDTALHHAARQLHSDACDVLLAHPGVNVAKFNSDGASVLTVLAARSAEAPAEACAMAERVLRQLQDGGGSVPQLLARSKALCEAVSQHIPSADFARLLLRYGALPGETKAGLTALQHIGAHGGAGPAARAAQGDCAAALLTALLQWVVEVANAKSEYAGRRGFVLHGDKATGWLRVRLLPAGDGEEDRALSEAPAAVVTLSEREVRQVTRGSASGGLLSHADFMHVVSMAWPGAVRVLVNLNAIRAYHERGVPFVCTDTLKDALRQCLGILGPVWREQVRLVEACVGDEGAGFLETACRERAARPAVFNTRDEWYVVRHLLQGLAEEHGSGAGAGFVQAATELLDASREVLTDTLPMWLFQEAVWDGDTAFYSPIFGQHQHDLKKQLCQRQYQDLAVGNRPADDAAAADGVPTPLKIFQKLVTDGVETFGAPNSLELATQYAWVPAVAWLLGQQNADPNATHTADRPIRTVSLEIDARLSDITGQALRAFDARRPSADPRQQYVDYMRDCDNPDRKYHPPVVFSLVDCVMEACNASLLLVTQMQVALLLFQHGADAGPKDFRRFSRIMRLDQPFDAAINGAACEKVSLLHVAAANNNVESCRWLLTVESYADTLGRGGLVDAQGRTARQCTSSHLCHELLSKREQEVQQGTGYLPLLPQVDMVIVLKPSTWAHQQLSVRETLKELSCCRRPADTAAVAADADGDYSVGPAVVVHALNQLDLTAFVMQGSGEPLCKVRPEPVAENGLFCLVSSAPERLHLPASGPPGARAGEPASSRDRHWMTKNIVAQFTWPVSTHDLRAASEKITEAVAWDDQSGASRIAFSDRRWVTTGAWLHYGRWVEYPSLLRVQGPAVEGVYALRKDAAGEDEVAGRPSYGLISRDCNWVPEEGEAWEFDEPSPSLVPTDHGVWRFVSRDGAVVLTSCAVVRGGAPTGGQLWQGRMREGDEGDCWERLDADPSMTSDGALESAGSGRASTSSAMPGMEDGGDDEEEEAMCNVVVVHVEPVTAGADASTPRATEAKPGAVVWEVMEPCNDRVFPFIQDRAPGDGVGANSMTRRLVELVSQLPDGMPDVLVLRAERFKALEGYYTKDPVGEGLNLRWRHAASDVVLTVDYTPVAYGGAEYDAFMATAGGDRPAPGAPRDNGTVYMAHWKLCAPAAGEAWRGTGRDAYCAGMAVALEMKALDRAPWHAPGCPWVNPDAGTVVPGILFTSHGAAMADEAACTAALNRKVAAMWGVRQLLIAAGVTGDDLPFRKVSRLEADTQCKYTPPNFTERGLTPAGQKWLDVLTQERGIAETFLLHCDGERDEIAEVWMPYWTLGWRALLKPLIWQPFCSASEYLLEQEDCMHNSLRYCPVTKRMYTRKQYLSLEPMRHFNVAEWERLTEFSIVNIKTPLFRRPCDAYYHATPPYGVADPDTPPPKIVCADVLRRGDAAIIARRDDHLWAIVDRPVALWWLPLRSVEDPAVEYLQSASRGDTPCLMKAQRDVPYYTENEAEEKVQDTVEVLPAGAVVAVEHLSLAGDWALVRHHAQKVYLRRMWAPLRTRDGSLSTFAPRYLEPLTKLENYFGSKTAFYFAYTSTYCTHLAALFCTGAIFTIVQATLGVGLHSNRVVVWNTVVVILWSSGFTRLWKRKSSELAYLWGVRNVEMWEPPMPDFFKRNVHYEKRPHPITGHLEPFIPMPERYAVYAFSVLICLSWAVFVSFVMYLNVQLRERYYRVSSDATMVVVLRLIFGFEAAICVAVLDAVFKRVAAWLNHNENHRSLSQLQGSAIVKNFLFRFLNGFSGLIITVFRDAEGVCPCPKPCHRACADAVPDDTQFHALDCPPKEEIEMCVSIDQTSDVMIQLTTMLVVQSLISTLVEKVIPRLLIERQQRQAKAALQRSGAFPACFPPRGVEYIAADKFDGMLATSALAAPAADDVDECFGAVSEKGPPTVYHAMLEEHTPFAALRGCYDAHYGGVWVVDRELAGGNGMRSPTHAHTHDDAAPLPDPPLPELDSLPLGVIFHVMQQGGRLTSTLQHISEVAGGGGAFTLAAFTAAVEQGHRCRTKSVFPMPAPGGGEVQAIKREWWTTVASAGEAPERWLPMTLCAGERRGVPYLDVALLCHNEHEDGVKCLRLRRVREVCTGQTSPAASVTLSDEERRRHHIRLDAAYHVYLYPPPRPLTRCVNPVTGCFAMPDVLDADAGGPLEDPACKVARARARTVRTIATEGAFVYLDRHHRPLEVRTGSGALDDGTPRMTYKLAVDWPSELTTSLWMARRFQPVLDKALRRSGARFMAWMLPSEELRSPEAGQKVWEAPPGGAFVVLFANDAGSLDDYDVPVGKPEATPMDRYYAADDGENQTRQRVLLEAMKPALSDASEFDDYTLMMLQFAYVICFAPVLPLAPLVALATAVLELHTDLYKLLELNKRVEARKASGIGAWMALLQAIVYVSIPINIIIGFRGKGWDSYTGDGTSASFLLLLAGGFVLVSVVQFAIPETARWVREYELRRDYELLQQQSTNDA